MKWSVFMNKKTKFWQQGDVVMQKIDSIPEGERSQDELTKAKTLALGEATGHSHTFDDVDNSVEVFKIMNVIYMRLAKETKLKHQEHNPISIPPGNYKVGIVRETDHLAGITRRVAD